MRIINYIVLTIFTGILLSCHSQKLILPTTIPQKDVEMRGVWIASVKNIDWPAHSNMSYEELKKSYIDILDFYEELNFNAVFVQLRTAGDALYPSQYAPWSRFLAGVEGQPLQQDIVPWLIEQSHRRGMEFHAWLNPYRATTSLDTLSLASNHVFYQHPECIVKYGPKYYLNPALPAVREHLLQVIDEVLEYDVDGIHFDDYFYPYKIVGELFADSLEYSFRTDASLSIDDWRRDNINVFVQSCHALIDNKKSHVQFGISPFGVWRNKAQDVTGSDTRAGQTIYDDLYADSRAWIRHGWLDYIAPQLYWSMEYPPAGHRTLVDWWTRECPDLPLYIGLGAYKVQNNHDTTWNDLMHLPIQIDYSRKTNVVDGFIVFSAKSIPANPKLEHVLKKHAFQQKAITSQQSKWFNSMPNIEFTMHADRHEKRLTIQGIDSGAKKLIIRYQQPGGFLKNKTRQEEIIEIQNNRCEIQLHKKSSNVSIALINSTGITSAFKNLDVN